MSLYSELKSASDLVSFAPGILETKDAIWLMSLLIGFSESSRVQIQVNRGLLSGALKVHLDLNKIHYCVKGRFFGM
jgi:hypothetical protein